MQARENPKTQRVTQLTALTGSETMASFSPDGKEIAFVWNGEKEDNADIYVKMTASAAALRLTSDAGADLLPSWSPDGQQIAFVRVHGSTAIYVVSPLGGPERKLFEFPGVDQRPDGPLRRCLTMGREFRRAFLLLIWTRHWQTECWRECGR